MAIVSRAFTIVGLLIAVVGSASTRANLIAFGGDQYVALEQPDELKLYFSIQFFFIKTGSLIGRFTNPVLKENVKCFGMDDCYPLGFGTPAIAMIIGFLLLLSIKSSYLRKPPSGNMLIKVIRCMMVSNNKFFFLLQIKDINVEGCYILKQRVNFIFSKTAILCSIKLMLTETSFPERSAIVQPKLFPNFSFGHFNENPTNLVNNSTFFNATTFS